MIFFLNFGCRTCPTSTRAHASVSWMASFTESPSLFTQGPPGVPGATGEKVPFPLKGPSEGSIHGSGYS